MLREQSAPDQLVEHAQRGTARQQVAAVRAAMVAEGDRVRDLFADEGGADRHAAAERLADRHQMRLEADGGEVERIARSPEPALHFIRDEQRAGAGARVRDRRGKRRRQQPDPAFALDRLDDDRRRRLRNGRAKGRRIVGRHEADPGEQRLERRAIVFVRRDRQRSERAAVKRLLERDDLVARLAPGVPIAPRELQARLDRFGAAVAEERARQPGQVRQPFGQAALQRVIEQVRRVDQRLRLIRDRAGQSRMGMPERGDADARQQIQVLAPLGVVEPHALRRART